jgi:nitrite reductase (NADH) small subunit
MTRHAVCALGDLPPGASVIVTIDRRSIGVFNVGGRLYALRNVCPHQGGPLCLGTVGGTMLPSRPQAYEYGLEGRVIRCPWHGWEFDLETGRSPFGAVGQRARTYPVAVEDGRVVVDA